MIQWYDEKLEPFLAVSLVWSNRCSASPIAIPYLHQGKHPPETPVKIERDPMVKSKAKCFWADTLVWHDETCYSPSSDSIATTRKTASGNYCKHLRTIQCSDQKFEPFWTITLLWRDRTSTSPSSESIPSPWKTSSRNSCKNSGVIQHMDQKFRRF